MPEALKIISIGGATQDVFVRSEGAQIMKLSDRLHEKAWLGFEYGAKVNVEAIRFTIGGGATNTSVAMAKLGLYTACLAKIGPDAAGQSVKKELESHGVSTELLLTGSSETGYSVILTSYEGERTILSFRGANQEIRAEELNWKALESADWLYISSLSGPSSEILEPLADLCQKKNIKISWNPGSSQIKAGLEKLKPLLSKTTLLILNKEEAAALTGIPLEKPQPEHLRPHQAVSSGRPAFMYDLNAHLKALKALGPDWVVITDGRFGVQTWDGKQAYAMPVYPLEVVDVLGAGDAFGAGLTAGWIYSGRDPISALKLGSANGAGVCTATGSHFGLQSLESAKVLIEKHPQIQPLAFEI